jgi:hypothetical protein
MGMPGDVIKLTTECLYFSEPQWINKVVFVMRNPRNMLQSQLKAGIFKKEDFSKAVDKQIRDTARTLDWITSFEKDFITVIYEDFLKNPKKTMKRVCNFLGRGDYKLGAEVVDIKLNRSPQIEMEYDGLKQLEEFYEWGAR